MNQYTDEKATLKESFTAALPPPAATEVPKRKSLTLQKLLSISCAALAAAVLVICGLEKLDSIAEKGICETVTELLLRDTASISETAFGSPLIASKPTVSFQGTYLTLPRIYYIPKESIVDNSLKEAKELKKKMFELYAFDHSKVPSGSYPIVPSDLSAGSYAALKNDTAFEIDMTAVEKEAALFEAEEISKEPLVLIVHTHGTEGFSEKGTCFYNDSFNTPRSEDVSKNVVAVGKVLTEALNKKGIPAVQCEIMHDKESYISAYERSSESIQEYLAKYPSIKYVFDVHRDSLIQSDLTKLRPVTLNDEKPCAQLMMIIGSSEKSGIDYDWTANLVLAEAIQKNLFSDTVGVARQLYLRGATYNQQYAKYGLLLEIGSCGNTLEEAKNAALAFADAFEKVIK